MSMAENLITRLVVDPAKVARALPFFAAMQADVRTNEPDATFYQWYQQKDQPNVFWVMEVFADAAAKDFHMARHQWRAAEFGEILIEPPVFNDVASI
jgi:quinol monooxygenase YgiN